MLPQDQDTGGFFIAVLRKKQSITLPLLDPMKSINAAPSAETASDQTGATPSPSSLTNNRRAVSTLVSKRQRQSASSDESFILLKQDADDLLAIK
jgi:hypothetical protein